MRRVPRHLPEPDPDTGLLPPGRYAANLADVHSAFVTSERFIDSATRARLWAEWEQHRAIVDAETGGVARIWLCGSFVSDKLDPDDVDVTYFLRADVYNRLGRDEFMSLDDLTDRTWCVEHRMRVHAHVVRLPDDMEFWQMVPGTFPAVINDSFRDIGFYDELWQFTRRSSPNDGEAVSRRGYVEVLL
jgi:predicted nucleotidyltransferase